MNQDEWYNGLNKWLLENATPQGTPENNNGWNCKKCGAELMGEEKIVSLNMEDYGGRPSLAGFGETRRITEPYCPKCGIRYAVPHFLEHGGWRDVF